MKEPSQTSGTLWGVCTFALLADSTPGLSCVLQEAMCVSLLPWTELCRAADSLFFYIYIHAIYFRLLEKRADMNVCPLL